MLTRFKGKTTLGEHIIELLQRGPQIATAYSICNIYTKGKNVLGDTMRILAIQLLRANLEIMPYVFEDYANKGILPSDHTLEN